MNIFETVENFHECMHFIFIGHPKQTPTTLSIIKVYDSIKQHIHNITNQILNHETESSERPRHKKNHHTNIQAPRAEYGEYVFIGHQSQFRSYVTRRLPRIKPGLIFFQDKYAPFQRNRHSREENILYGCRLILNCCVAKRTRISLEMTVAHKISRWTVQHVSNILEISKKAKKSLLAYLQKKFGSFVVLDLPTRYHDNNILMKRRKNVYFAQRGRKMMGMYENGVVR